jgi:anti-sigma B factor antagonist
MGLQIKVRKIGRVAILDLSGCATLDSRGSELLSSRLRRLIAEGARHFLLNLEQLTQIDSSGVSVLVEIYVSLTHRGGQLKLLRPRQRVDMVLHIFRLLEAIPTFEDESEALKSFGLPARSSRRPLPPLPVRVKYLGHCCG